MPIAAAADEVDMETRGGDDVGKWPMVVGHSPTVVSL